MEHIKYIKLVNGENLIVTTDNDCKNFKQNKFINVINPVQIVTLKLNQGPLVVESFAMSTWIRMAVEDVIEIPTESIVIAVDIIPQAIEQYRKFVEELKESTTTVAEEESGNYEELYEEEDEEDDREFERIVNRRKSGTTVH